MPTQVWEGRSRLPPPPLPGRGARAERPPRNPEARFHPGQGTGGVSAPSPGRREAAVHDSLSWMFLSLFLSEVNKNIKKQKAVASVSEEGRGPLSSPTTGGAGPTRGQEHGPCGEGQGCGRPRGAGREPRSLLPGSRCAGLRAGPRWAREGKEAAQGARGPEPRPLPPPRAARPRGPHVPEGPGPPVHLPC